MKRVIAVLSAVAALMGVAYYVSAAPPSTPGHLDCYDGFSETPIPDDGVRLECLPPPTTTTTVAPTTTTSTTTTTTAPTTTAAPTTTTRPPQVVHVWSGVTAGSNREPELLPDPSTPPNSTGICFYRNNVFNRCDATPSPYQMYPPMTLVNGDVLRGEWTTIGGAAVVSTHVVGGVPSPTTTTPPTVTTIPGTTTTVPSTGGFVEMFDNNSGLDRLVYGIHHRDDFAWADTWPGDHDLNCGSPATQRTISRFNPAESFYVCADHIMTSIGDASSYSVGWFEPDADGDGVGDVFSRADVNSVAWDVNVTDLGPRQWWEVIIVPADYQSGFADCPHCAVHWSVSPSPSNLPAFPAGTSGLGLGPLGGDGMLVADGSGDDPLGWCHVYDCVDPEGAGSKQIRRTFWMRDNGDGTITFEFFGERTYPGSFPDQFRVVFKDHNYTPSKDNNPVGFTWHWDSIVIT